MSELVKYRKLKRPRENGFMFSSRCIIVMLSSQALFPLIDFSAVIHIRLTVGASLVV